MSEFKTQARPERASNKPGRKTSGPGISRHRAEPARPTSAFGRFAAGLPSFGRRAAVLTTAAAVLVGVGAAGQAADQAAPSAAETSVATADAGQTLSFDRTLISALPAPSAGSVAPQSSSQAADKEATAKAAAAKKVADAKTAAAKAAAAKTAATNAAAAKAAAAKAAAAQAAAAKAAAAKAAATAKAKAKAAAPVAVNDPAGAQAYAASKLGSFGWSADQMQCLKKLWTKESEWRTTATNASSGAYGIVQSLPAEKMASSGADYRTNYRTQINWGLGYIKERYGSPCGALNWHLSHNWY